MMDYKVVEDGVPDVTINESLTCDWVKGGLDLVVTKLNDWVGGLGRKAFEDIYTPNFCSLNLFSQPITGAIAAILLLYIFIYLFGVLFNNRKYVNMALSEFWEMIILLPMVVVLLQVPCLSIPGSDLSIYQGGLLYLQSSITSTILSLYPFTLSYGIIVSAQVSLSQNWLGMGPPDTKPPSILYTDYSWNMLYSNAALFLTIGHLAQVSFLHLFDLLTYGLVKYLLPFALLLRFIPPTKRIGGGLIGLVIGLAIFMPLIFWINYQFVKAYGLVYYEWDADSGTAKLEMSPFVDMVTKYYCFLMAAALTFVLYMFISSISGLNRYVQKVASKYASKLKKAASTLASTVFKKLGAWLKQGIASTSFAELIKAAYTLFTINSQLFLVIMVYLPLFLISWVVVAYAILLNLVIPALTFIVVATGVRALTGLFGQEIDISNLTRLV